VHSLQQQLLEDSRICYDYIHRISSNKRPTLIDALLSPYKAKKKEKWELISLLLNNFFKKKWSKNKRPGAFIRRNTSYTFRPFSNERCIYVGAKIES
jgi:hypothetical protein